MVRARRHADIRPAARASREKPSVAVLPCWVSAADPEHRLFGECVAEGIATALSRVRSLSVVLARSPQSGASFDPKRLARELGARYLIVGSLARSGERLRIVIRLLDAASGAHVCGDTYDGDVVDLFGLQDRVTEGVMRATLPQIRDARVSARNASERRPRRHDPPCGRFIFATYPRAAVRALDLLNRNGDRSGLRARNLLALRCHAQLVLHNGTRSPSEEQARALLSERAGLPIRTILC